MENVIDTLKVKRSAQQGWDLYKPLIEEFVSSSNGTVLEIGAGRSPLFSLKEISDMGCNYVANDISEPELNRLSDSYARAHFDICGDIPSGQSGMYDVVFSKMVLEHVSDGGKYYSNAAKLLRSGGVLVTFHPTLYCAPFVLNSLMPEGLSRRLLAFIMPNRTDDGVPKFPAVYSYCRSTHAQEKKIENIGFKSVEAIALYGHSYYQKFPLADKVQQRVADALARLDVRFFSSFSFTIAYK